MEKIFKLGKYFYNDITFSIYDLFKNIDIEAKLKYVFYYFSVKNDLTEIWQKNIPLHKLVSLFKDSLNQYSFKLTLVDMNETTKKYFNYHCQYSLFFLFERFYCESEKNLSSNKFLKAILRKHFNLEVIITALNTNNKNLFQPFHSMKIVLNNEDVTKHYKNFNIFYSLGEDFGDGVTNDYYSKESKLIYFSTIII